MGRVLAIYAGYLNWDHQEQKFDWRLRYTDIGEEFRADTGFVPQAGYRAPEASGGWRFYPDNKFLSFIRTYFAAEKQFLTNGDDLGHDYFPGIFLIGSQLNAEFEYHDSKALVSDQLISERYFSYFVQFDPSRTFFHASQFPGRTGESIDFENARPGTGSNISLTANVRPFDHFTLTADAARDWLDLDEPTASGRLYTASIARLKAVYVFNARSFVRLHRSVRDDQAQPGFVYFPRSREGW